MRILRSALLLLLLLLPFATVGEAQQGGSLGVSPTRHDVADARRGETYQRAIVLQNQFDEPTEVTASGVGEVGAWLSFSPAAVLRLAPRAEATLLVNVTVPADAENGDHDGQVQVQTEAKGAPEGSGFGVHHAASVLLRVRVGGEESRKIMGVGLAAPDVERGADARALLTLRNDGNVRATVMARAQAFELGTGRAVAEATAQALLVPGETRAVELVFAGLPLGQYRVRATLDAPDSFEAEAELKVVERGTLGKSGLLRAILHAPRAQAGRPVEVTIRFENTGNVTIGDARFLGSVAQGDETRGVLETQSLVVRPGETVDFTAFFTPEGAGEHVLKGRVVYDGFQTPLSESLLTVEGAATGSRTPLPPLLVVAALGLAASAWRKSARR
jgi:hypothetical protein